jgi:glucuronosyltransferase
LKAVADPKVAKKAKEVSKLFRDKPQKPLDVAVWWVEYVIRNPKLENLRSPTLKLGFFASQSYDVLLAVIGVLHVLLYILLKIVRAVKSPSRPKRKAE